MRSRKKRSQKMSKENGLSFQVVPANTIKVKRRGRTTQYTKLLDEVRGLRPGQALMVTVPPGRDPAKARHAIATLLRREVRADVKGKIECRLTTDDRVAITVTK